MKRHQRAGITALSLATVATLSGCGLMPDDYAHYEEFIQAEKTERHTTPLDDDALETKLSYFSSPMMLDNYREDFLSDLGESRQVQEWVKDGWDTGVDAGQMGTLVGDVASGQMGSLAGDVGTVGGLAAGFVIGSGLFTSNQEDGAGQAMLPGEMYGRSLDTPADATWALKKMLNDRLQSLGNDLSWGASCVDGCDPSASGTTITYILKADPNKPLSDAFPYRYYDNIGITIAFLKPRKIEDNNPIQAFTDYETEWVTGPSPSLGVYAYTMSEDVAENPSWGDYYLVLSDKERFESDEAPGNYLEMQRGISRTVLGETLYAYVHRDGYSYEGLIGDSDNIGYLAYDGKLYGLKGTYKSEGVDKLIDIPEIATQERSAPMGNTESDIAADE